MEKQSQKSDGQPAVSIIQTSDTDTGSPSCSSQTIEKFLQLFVPHLHVCAFGNEGGPEGHYFGSDLRSAVAFAVRCNRNGSNIYFTPNIPTSDCGIKPSKSQISMLRGLHVDIDPAKDGSAFDKPGVIAKVLKDCPSMIVDSGGGIHAYWNFLEPIDTTPENIREVETLNRSLVERFNGDKAAVNVDRVLRVPGTINWPNAKKAAAGRLPVMAARVPIPTHSLATLGQFQEHFGTSPAAQGPIQVDRAPNQSVDDQSVVTALCRSFAIAALYGGDFTAYDSDASAGDMALVNAIAPRTGFDREQTERIWLSSPLGQREKTKNRADYRHMTVSKALESNRNGAPSIEAARTSGNGLLPTIDVGELDDCNIPPRKWHVEGLIPASNVTLLSGDGGSGKSLLALQLCASTVLGKSWIETKPITQGPVLYLSAEDDIPEVHRRMVDIVRAEGVSLRDLRGLIVASLADRNALLAVSGRAGSLDPTLLYTALEERIAAINPSLVVIDTLADTFGGNEIDRAQARQFIAMLRRLAIKYDLTLVVLAHPSQSGMSSGSGTSGSTGWSNSVRSRLYLKRDEHNADLRKLELMKSNYGSVGTQIHLQWRNGAFQVLGYAESNAAHKETVQCEVDEQFVEFLIEANERGQTLSPAPSSPSYAPKRFADHPKTKANKQGFSKAMNRLLLQDRIRETTSSGPPSKRKTILALVKPSTPPANSGSAAADPTSSSTAKLI